MHYSIDDNLNPMFCMPKQTLHIFNFGIDQKHGQIKGRGLSYAHNLRLSALRRLCAD